MRTQECRRAGATCLLRPFSSSVLDHVDEILDAAEGSWSPAGISASETPFARVPIVQKHLIAEVNRRAKPVITATQMIFSMVSSPQPTRAEVADVANAVVDEDDAVMLSEETAVGRHAGSTLVLARNVVPEAVDVDVIEGGYLAYEWVGLRNQSWRARLASEQ